MGEDRLLGRRGRVVLGAVLDGAEGEVDAPALGSTPVAGFVRDDPEQPRPERRAVTEPRKGPVRLHECLLDCVVGLVGAADQAGRSEREVLEGAHELLVRIDVAVAGAHDELRFVQWSALHVRWFYTGCSRAVPGMAARGIRYGRMIRTWKDRVAPRPPDNGPGVRRGRTICLFAFSWAFARLGASLPTAEAFAGSERVA